MRFASSLIAGVSAGLVAAVLAGGMHAEAGDKAPRRKKDRGTQELCGIKWQPTVEKAVPAAGETRDAGEAKPIFCLRVLGDLNGFM